VQIFFLTSGDVSFSSLVLASSPEPSKPVIAEEQSDPHLDLLPNSVLVFPVGSHCKSYQSDFFQTEASFPRVYG
jgi:hypothetical protein